MNSSPFPFNSRYHGVELATLTLADGEQGKGRQILYLRRRFVPAAENFHSLHQHTVTQGDRLDNIAAKYFGDPEQFWRICDANNAMRPEELAERMGHRLNITLPEGVPGPATS